MLNDAELKPQIGGMSGEAFGGYIFVSPERQSTRSKRSTPYHLHPQKYVDSGTPFPVYLLRFPGNAAGGYQEDVMNLHIMS